MNKIFSIIFNHLWANQLFKILIEGNNAIYVCLFLFVLIMIGYFVKLKRN